MIGRDPTVLTKIDVVLEDAEDELDCAMSSIAAAIAQCARQSGPFTESALSDASKSLADVIEDLRAARENLTQHIYEDA